MVRSGAPEPLFDEGEIDGRTGIRQVRRMAAEAPGIQRQLQNGQQKALILQNAEGNVRYAARLLRRRIEEDIGHAYRNRGIRFSLADAGRQKYARCRNVEIAQRFFIRRCLRPLFDFQAGVHKRHTRRMHMVQVSAGQPVDGFSAVLFVAGRTAADDGMYRVNTWRWENTDMSIPGTTLSSGARMRNY